MVGLEDKNKVMLETAILEERNANFRMIANLFCIPMGIFTIVVGIYGLMFGGYSLIVISLVAIFLGGVLIIISALQVKDLTKF